MSRINLRSAILFFLLAFLGWKCAAVAPPGGGPVDKIPPELLGVTPPNGTLGFEGGTIQLEFSEYMDEKSVTRAFRVSPRMKAPIPVTYKGKILEFDFPRKLTPNQTYVLTLSRELKDEHGVPIKQPIQIAYSTGTSIDGGTIGGRVYGPRVYTVHLWKTVPDDSLFARPPLYLTDTNDQGVFQFKYLPTGDFSLVVVERSFAGLALNTERTAYGVPQQWRYHLETDGNIDHLRIRPWNEPPPLRLDRGEWIGNRWGWLYFNRALEDSEKWDSLSLTLKDGTVVKARSFADQTKRLQYLILSEDSLPPGKMMVRVGPVYSGEHLVTEPSALDIRVPEEPDTSYLALIRPDSILSLRPDGKGGPPLKMVFSKPVTGVNPIAFSMMIEDSNLVDIQWSQSTPMGLEIRPVKGWLPKTEYKFTIRTDLIQPMEGRSFRDSVVTILVHSGKEIGYGGLEGTVVDSTHRHLVTVLTPLKKPPRQYTAFVNSGLQFQYKEIPEGLYQFMLFDDTDQNGTYTYGRAYPFQPSEWFYMLPDTISIRANWDIEMSPIQIQEPAF
jgi:hypothetical protein